VAELLGGGGQQLGKGADASQSSKARVNPRHRPKAVRDRVLAQRSLNAGDVQERAAQQSCAARIHASGPAQCVLQLRRRDLQSVAHLTPRYDVRMTGCLQQRLSAADDPAGALGEGTISAHARASYLRRATLRRREDDGCSPRAYGTRATDLTQ
jgi:hypothetical protein